MYQENSDDITLKIQKRENTPQNFDKAMLDIREQLAKLNTYYLNSVTIGEYAMMHTFYSVERNAMYLITDYDVMLAMDGNELNFLANYIDPIEQQEALETLGYDSDNETVINWDIADEYTLSHFSDLQYAELQREDDSGVYTY